MTGTRGGDTKSLWKSFSILKATICRAVRSRPIADHSDSCLLRVVRCVPFVRSENKVIVVHRAAVLGSTWSGKRHRTAHDQRGDRGGLSIRLLNRRLFVIEVEFWCRRHEIVAFNVKPKQTATTGK